MTTVEGTRNIRALMIRLVFLGFLSTAIAFCEGPYIISIQFRERDLSQDYQNFYLQISVAITASLNSRVLEI